MKQKSHLSIFSMVAFHATMAESRSNSDRDHMATKALCIYNLYLHRNRSKPLF
jgi:hypothetical protein